MLNFSTFLVSMCRVAPSVLSFMSNSFTNENNSQTFENQLSFLHYHTKCNKVKKLLNPSRQLYINLYQITQTKLVYTGTKLGLNFQIKDKTKFDHKHDLVFYVKCPECHEYYIGKIGGRLHEQICNYSRKDSKSYMLKHSLENNHKNVSFEDFHIVLNGYTNWKFKQKIVETLFIKDLQPLLNTQETSVPLLLYND